MPRLAVIFTGGTISMRSTPTGSGNAPALGAEQLLQTVPGIDRIAELEPVDWGLVPGSHLTFEQVLDIGRLINRQLERHDIDGVVLVQGTDNIEETAFAWDLLPLPDKPVVVVGAMRAASQDGYDGPENLRNAIAAAASADLADQGVVVAMAGTIHAADAVRKTNSHAYATFQSVNAGQLGTVADGQVSLTRRRRPARLPSVPNRVPPVAFVTALLGEGQARIDVAAEGVIVQAMGGGNTQAELLEAAREAMQRGVTVVLTTRCPSGGVRPGYGFPGGSSTWWEAGAVFSGWLDALKARVALGFALGARLERPQIVELFSRYGGGSSR